MPSNRPPLAHVKAIRACGVNRRGMRYGAHLTAMRALELLGYVEARVPPGRREARWFLTPAGKDLLASIGTGEASDF